MGFLNIPDLILQHFNARPEEIVLIKNESFSYRNIWEKMSDLSKGLIDLGHRPGSKAAIISTNCPEWVITDLGVMMLGAINVPIYPTLSPQEMAYILNDSEAEIAFVQSQLLLDALALVADHIPKLKRIVVFEPFSMATLPAQWEVMTFDALLEKGKAAESKVQRLHTQYFMGLHRENNASIVYTSGTTGPPKGVILTHDNFLSNVEDLLEVTPLSQNDKALSFLPLSHVFERTVGYYTILAAGGKIHYAQSISTVADELLVVNPTIVVSVPRLYEKIKDKILLGLTPTQHRLFSVALMVGRRKAELNKKGVTFAPITNLVHRFFDHKVYAKIRAKFGGNIRFFVSGGAPLNIDVSQFFEGLGFLIIEGYGMTETSPVIACNRYGNYKLGTVGLALPSVKTKLADDGELLVQGPLIMRGYYGPSYQGQPIVDDQGWFHTGDIAKIDAEGFIQIIDRKKELIVLSNGKKVAPQVIEARILTNPKLAQVMIVGEKKSYITALVVPQTHVVQPYPTDSVVIDDAALNAQLLKEIEQSQSDMANYEKIKKIIVLRHEFSAEKGEVTPTLKLKRKVIEDHYKDQIEALYQA